MLSAWAPCLDIRSTVRILAQFFFVCRNNLFCLSRNSENNVEILDIFKDIEGVMQKT